MDQTPQMNPFRDSSPKPRVKWWINGKITVFMDGSCPEGWHEVIGPPYYIADHTADKNTRLATAEDLAFADEEARFRDKQVNHAKRYGTKVEDLIKAVQAGIKEALSYEIKPTTKEQLKELVLREFQRVAVPGLEALISQIEVKTDPDNPDRLLIYYPQELQEYMMKLCGYDKPADHVEVSGDIT